MSPALGKDRDCRGRDPEVGRGDCQGHVPRQCPLKRLHPGTAGASEPREGRSRRGRGDCTASVGQAGGAQGLRCRRSDTTKALVTLQVGEVVALERGPQDVWPPLPVTSRGTPAYVVPIEGRSP